MSSLNAILDIATSGLQTSQTLLSVTSDNISNVNTAGYTRKVASQEQLVTAGTGSGVTVSAVTLAANQFLQAASLSASATSSQASVTSTYLTQAQALFGDPSSSTSFFNGLNTIYSAFASAAATPSSSLSRTDALNSVNTFLSSAENLSTSLTSLQSEAGQQVSTDVATVNSLLSQIAQANNTISQVSVSGGDASGAQDNQSELINQLGALMQVQVQANATGGVTVRAADGTALVDGRGAATVGYSTTGASTVITATPPTGTAQQIRIGSGAIAGLIQMNQVALPQLSTQLSEFVSQAVSQINAAHNASSAVPPPTTLTGTNIGMDASTAVSGFSGKTTVAITNSAGVLQKTVAIDFGADTMSVNGGAATSFTPSTFVSSLNTALGTSGSASFTNGVLSLSATGSNGVAIADDATTPSQSSNGESFSQFFGLNNLIQSNTVTNFNTGLTAASPNTFAAGGEISLELTDSTGAAIRQANITIPASATTVGGVVSALNAGVGAYGAFSLDSQGQLTFTPAANSGVSVSVVSDNTVNSVGGLSLSQTFGIGSVSRSNRTGSFSIRPDISNNPSNLALGTLDLTQSIGGSPALGAGDGSGASAIANSGSVTTSIPAAGALSAMQSTVSNYAAELSGQVGAAATAASDAQQSAAALSTQADSQRSSVEGVNLDQELVNLTTYQQSYQACSRLILASSDMFNTLLQMV